MTTSAASAPATTLQQLQAHIQTGLAPLVSDIDRQGLYPQPWLQGFAELGGLSALASPAQGGSGHGLAAHIERLAAVGATCGATAFSLWCQSACAWYVRQSDNSALRQRYLPDLLQGRLWAGTGLSNTVKHLSGIEPHLLQARPEGEGDSAGLRVSGSLPWVSNLGDNHALITSAQLPDGSFAMFIVHAGTPGLRLRDCPEFCGLEGTRTLNVRFDNVWIPQADLLVGPDAFIAFSQRIKPGFVLLQMGMALGVIEASIQSIETSHQTGSPTNAWLDDQPQALRAALNEVRQRTLALAEQAETGQAQLLDVLRVRLAGSELALRATQSDALHAGARGYLMRHGAQRRSREALFVAIVTPALKQLRRDIARLEGRDTPATASPHEHTADAALALA